MPGRPLYPNEKKKKLISGILSGKSFNKAFHDAGYTSNKYTTIRKDPEVLAAIEDALQANKIDNARIIAGILQIAEEGNVKDRLRAWELLATMQQLLQEAKNLPPAPQETSITVKFVSKEPVVIADDKAE